MELLADAPFMLTLGALALIDGLSVGTLLIPVFLLLSPGRVRAGRIVLYLLAITVFYLLVGLLFLWGLVNVAEVASDWLSSPTGAIVRLAIGAAMLVGSFFISGPKKDSPAASDAARPANRASLGAPVGEQSSVARGRDTAGSDRDASPYGTASYGSASPASGPGGGIPLTPPPPAPAPVASGPRPPQGRLTRWRDQLLDPRTRPTVVIGVAILAGLAEVATMLPYIAAMTMLAQSGAQPPVSVLALVGYCVLMIAPALVLLVLRIVAAPLVERPLQRLADWLSRSGAETTAWIVGIIGFLVARAAAMELGLFG